MTDRREKILTFFLIVIAGIVAAWIFAFGVRADTITVKPGDDLKAKVASLKAGDVLKIIGDGKPETIDYGISGAMYVPSGVTLVGDGLPSILPGNVPQNGYGSTAWNTYRFGIVLADRSVGTSITGIDFRTGVRLNGATNVRFTGNAVQAINAVQANPNVVPVGTSPGVFNYGGFSGCVFEGNYFHDFEHWAFLIQGPDNSSFSNNVFRNVTQGAHVLNPRNNVQFNGNVGTGLNRMGLEIQQAYGYEAANGTFNLSVQNNVFSDWRTPYWDSFGLSIMPQIGKGTVVKGNYIRATRTGNFSQTDSSGVPRWGYGIEFGSETGSCENNTIIGPWTNHVICSTQGNVFRGNALFGVPLWTAYIGAENGVGPPLGKWGTPVLFGNTTDANMSNAPGLPTSAVARLLSPLSGVIVSDTTSGGVGGVSAVNPPVVYVTDAGNLVSFSGLQPGDTISIRGNDGKWRVIGDTGGNVLTWAVTPEFDNWIVWAKLDRGPASSAEVKLPQLHYVAPTSEPTTAELQAKLDRSLADYAALKIDRDQLKANIDDVTAKVTAKNAALLEAAAKLQELAK